MQRVTARCDRCKEKDRLYVNEHGKFCYDCRRVLATKHHKLDKKKKATKK